LKHFVELRLKASGKPVGKIHSIELFAMGENLRQWGKQIMAGWSK